MAYAPIPQFISIHSPKIGCNELPMTTITEVLQSSPVKRLLHRQNVFLQNPVASSSTTSDFPPSSKSSLRERNNGTIGDSNGSKKPELTVIPIMSLSTNVSPRVSNVEDKHLLPSKYEGKSGVALMPIRRERKQCGHYEPCENIVCDVAFQQYADVDTVSPLIAVNIDASEIDAPVTKHCNNKNCDALSIDHDRCRRAIIRCHRCDQSNTCDVCLVVLKTRKSQMTHKNCKMRVEYRHNRTSRGQILKDRMRQREVEILEAAKINKNDYTDPVTGHDRAIEALHNNSELIVIPKNSLPIQQHPTIRITSVTGSAITSKTPGTVETYGKILPQFPIVFPHQGMLLGKRVGAENPENQTPFKRVKLVGLSESANLPSGSGNPQNSFITVTRMPATNFIKPVNISNLLQSTVQVNSTPALQSTSFLMPVRVVETQGIPRYCLVPDITTNHSLPTYVNPPPSKILSVRAPSRDKIELNVEKDLMKSEMKTEQQVLKKFKPGQMRRGRRKKTGAKKGSKSFECTFCFKRFSTDWYFKLHIAKHKGEIKFTCKFCKKPFMHLYNMTKHIVTMHKKEAAADETLTEEDIAENIDENEQQSLCCGNCNVSFESEVEMENHPCCVLCLRCNARILDGNLMFHLKSKHNMTDEKAVEEYERQKRQSVVAGKNRVKTKRREIQSQSPRRVRIKEEKEEEEEEEDATERENGLLRTKRHSTSPNDPQNVRRRTRRRYNSTSEMVETILPNKTEVLEEEITLEADADISDQNQTSQEPKTIICEY